MKKGFKKVLSTLIAVLILISVCPLSELNIKAQAATLNYLTYNIKNDSEVEITKCSADATGEIIIPSEIEGYPVTKIGNSAFKNCSGVTYVEIPETVTTINNDAFYSSGLQRISIPSGVKSIPDYCFRYCKSLQSAELPEGLNEIGRNAFEGCVVLSDVDIPGAVTEIEEYAFSETAITSAAIPSGITVIPDYLFYKCKSLQNIDIHNAVTEIGNFSFSKCVSLSEITLPDNLVKIGQQAFQDCAEIKTINLPFKLEEISYGAFWGCTGLNTDLVIPDSVTSIGQYAFSETSVTGARISSNVTSLPYQAFCKCSLLEQVILPENLTEIGDCVFYECTALKDIVLPEGLLKIGLMAFDGCTALESINLPSTLTTINESAFSECTSLASDLVIPEGVTVLNDSLFSNCYKLKNVELHNGITYIGTGVFFNTGILTVVLPDSVKTLEDRAFTWKTVQLPLPKSLETIGEAAFSSAKLVDSEGKTVSTIDIPEAVKTIEKDAFYLSSSLKEVNIPASVESIDANAFPFPFFNVDGNNQCYYSDEFGILYDKSLSHIIQVPKSTKEIEFTIPETVTQVTNGAFYNCNFTKIIIPDGLVTINGNTFMGCTKAFFEVGEGNPNYATDASGALYSKDYTTLFRFPSSNAEKEIVVPESVEIIRAYAFNMNTNMQSIYIGENVKEIRGNAFKSVTNLTNVYYGGTEEKWNAIEIASYNENLTNATIHYNYGKESGSCGENATYSYDADSKTLTISGEGDMFSFADPSEYDWYCYRDEVEFISINSKVTLVGANAFANFSALKEVVMSNTVTYMGENAFLNCPKLSLVSSTAGKFELIGNPFDGCNERIVLFGYATNHGFNDFAQSYGYKLVPVSFDSEKNVLKFNSQVTVYNDLDYQLLKKFLNTYSRSEYIYFSKLVFHGVEPEFIDVEDLENEVNAQYLTFNNLYVSLKAVKEEAYEDVTFSQFIELMENGEYDAFMFELKSDEGSQTITLEERWNQIVEDFIEDVLRITSKIINFFRKLFK